MYSLPKQQLFGFLLPSLIKAGILTPRVNDANHPALLLPTTNDTTMIASSGSADTAWYPYAASSSPISPITSPLTIPSLNATTSSSLTAPKIVCNGTRYGRNLRIASCLNALGRMDASTETKSYGQRNAHAPSSTTWDASLPLRILSSDARCAIDITHSPRSPHDTIIPATLKSHALTLLSICVRGDPSLGGVVTDIGDEGDLAIRIMPYRPNVHCFGQGTGAPWETCRDLIDGMPVGGERRRFVPEGMGEGGVGDVVVPWRRTTGARRCEITIDTVSGPDVSDFYKLWAAASAVDTLCIIKGKAGMAVGNGLNGHLVVGLKDARLEPSDEAGVKSVNGNMSVSVSAEMKVLDAVG